jgi:hypothetical protein
MTNSVKTPLVSPTPKLALVLFASLSAASLFIAPVSAQSVVYRETFYTPSGTLNRLNDASPSLGWHLDYVTSVGGTVTNGDGVSTRSNLTGRPTALPAVNAGSYAGSDLGLMFSNFRQGFFYTNEYAGLLSQDLTQISWYEGNSSASITQQVALQVGSTWYVSNTTFTSAAISGADFGTLSEQKTLSLAGSTWKELTYTSGGAGFSISSTAIALPTGTVNGFGLFFDTAGTGGNARFDTFEITSIPEPSSIAFILGAVSLGVIGFRRLSDRRRNLA